MRKLLVAILCVIIALAVWMFWPRDTFPLRSNGTDALVVLLFGTAFDSGNLSKGWSHRTFWFVPPMELSSVRKDGEITLRCATDAGGSLLIRDVDIQVAAYPRLSWRWLVETPIISDLDEASEDGDDHPARLYLRFDDKTATEIIWSNGQFAAGEARVIGNFYHLVANGGPDAVGIWQNQTVDLMKLYKDAGGLGQNPGLSKLGIFCDSDNGGGSSVAYFGDVILRRP
jgi:hypothetical protein